MKQDMIAAGEDHAPGLCVLCGVEIDRSALERDASTAAQGVDDIIEAIDKLDGTVKRYVEQQERILVLVSEHHLRIEKLLAELK